MINSELSEMKLASIWPTTSGSVMITIQILRVRITPPPMYSPGEFPSLTRLFTAAEMALAGTASQKNPNETMIEYLPSPSAPKITAISQLEAKPANVTSPCEAK